MQTTPTITIAKGDGIGPEIMNSVLTILESAGARLNYDEIQIGEAVYLGGNSSGISKEAWNTLRKNKIFLKAPITTPQGGGYKSLNVTTRKALNLFANVRPCVSYHPYIKTKHPELDVVIIRENEEDLYAGIEHQQTAEVVQCLKLISRPGCEKIIRYAFEYAVKHNRKKVTCFTKDNIMKQTDGLFRRVFNEISAEYPQIASDHMIIDIGSARMADSPEWFDVVVTGNLYGDILSDIAAQITGSVGLAGSANIGTECAMFEAIHGSAPDIAGKDVANPSGLLHAAIMMLNHLGQSDVAADILNAWYCVIEKGIHTPDIYNETTSTRKIGTRGFTEAIIAHIGQKPAQMKPADIANSEPITIREYKRTAVDKKLVGVDVFVDWSGRNPDELAAKLRTIETKELQLVMITNRGIKVWPEGMEETFCTDHWRCRFQRSDAGVIEKSNLVQLLQLADIEGVDTIKTENLYTFDGQPAFSLGQGQ